MPYFYLSFCDTERPNGPQLLGATVVAADNEHDAFMRACVLGLNPGGEVAMCEFDELRPAGSHYLNRFVPRKQVMSEPHHSMADLDADEAIPTVCQSHNPRIL